MLKSIDQTTAPQLPKKIPTSDQQSTKPINSPPQSSSTEQRTTLKKKQPSISGESKKLQLTSSVDAISNTNIFSQKPTASTSFSNLHEEINAENHQQNTQHTVTNSIEPSNRTIDDGLDIENIIAQRDELPVTYKLLKSGLSCLGVSPDGVGYVYLRLSLPVHIFRKFFLKFFFSYVG
jgi:hypothetical protein